MSYILHGTTLPDPKRFSRVFIETVAEHLIMDGKTTKRVQNRKEQFTLEYQYLTMEQVNNILSLYDLDQALTFQITETNLPIAQTDILMDIEGREYPPVGRTHRENLIIILTEIL